MKKIGDRSQTILLAVYGVGAIASLSDINFLHDLANQELAEKEPSYDAKKFPIHVPSVHD